MKEEPVAASPTKNTSPWLQVELLIETSAYTLVAANGPSGLVPLTSMLPPQLAPGWSAAASDGCDFPPQPAASRATAARHPRSDADIVATTPIKASRPLGGKRSN